MNDLLRETLATRAEATPPPVLDVDALVARGEDRLRRRRAGIIAGSVAAVAVVVVLALVGSALTGGTHSSPPVVHPTPTTTPSDLPVTQPTRDILWSEVPFAPGAGLVHDRGRFHYRDKVLRVEHAFVATDVTDDGFLWVSARHEVWFSDGVDRERIGTHQCYGGLHGFPNAVETDNAGSRAAWFDCTDPRSPVLVVHDTSTGSTRLVPVPRCAGAEATCEMTTMVGDHVYWRWYASDGSNRTRMLRYDVAAAAREVVTDADLAADVRNQYRALVTGRSWAAGEVDDGLGISFTVQGRRLVAGVDPGIAGSTGTPVWVAATGAPVHLRLPRGYHGRALAFSLFEWLDDETVALAADEGDIGAQQGWAGDILRCRISTGRCVLAVRGSAGNRLILLPGQGLPG